MFNLVRLHSPGTDIQFWRTEGSPRAGRNSDSEAERLAQSARSSGSGTNLGLGLPLNPPKTKYGAPLSSRLSVVLLASPVAICFIARGLQTLFCFPIQGRMLSSEYGH